MVSLTLHFFMFELEQGKNCKVIATYLCTIVFFFGKSVGFMFMTGSSDLFKVRKSKQFPHAITNNAQLPKCGYFEL